MAWLVDSGCNRHMTPNRGDLNFTNLQSSNVECTFGNKDKLRAECYGQAQVDVISDTGNKVKIILDNVLYVPGLPQKMLKCFQQGNFTDLGVNFFNHHVDNPH